MSQPPSQERQRSSSATLPGAERALRTAQKSSEGCCRDNRRCLLLKQCPEWVHDDDVQVAAVNQCVTISFTNDLWLLRHATPC